MAERFEDISNKDMETVQISLPGTLAATATNYDVFFIAQRVYDIVEVSTKVTDFSSLAEDSL